MQNISLSKSYTELSKAEMQECFDISKNVLWRYINDINDNEKDYGHIYDYIATYAKQAYTYYCLLNDLPVQGKKYIKK